MIIRNQPPGMSRNPHRTQSLPWHAQDREDLPKPRLSISEVAALFGLEEHTLRYWEQETRLSPKRAPGSGARVYEKEDLLIVEKLHYLIEIKGYTLRAAAELLDAPHTEAALETRNRLLSVRERLVALRDRLNEPTPKHAGSGDER